MVEPGGKETMAPSAEIIVIGSNLLSSHLSDEARSCLAAGLVKNGFRVERFSVIRDDEKTLEELLLKGLQNPDVNIVVVVGGIDSESGDIASRVAARVTGRRLVVSDDILAHMKSILESRGREMSHSDERLALIPRMAQVLKNPGVPFCGFMLKEGKKKLFFLPGRSEDMRALSRGVLFPLLSEELPSESLVFSRRFHVIGLGKEGMRAMLAEVLPPMGDVEIAYNEALADTELRLSIRGARGAERLEKLTDLLRESLGDRIFAEDDGSMEETVGNLLRLKRASLATAESCTGGGIGDLITNVPGSSDYFEMGVIAYSNEAKTKLLGVQPSVIEKNGAVSSEVALDMAQGIQRLGRTTFGLAVTGIAGPGGGSREKPVGTVYIALFWDEEKKYEKHLFEGNREEVKKLTSQAALDLLRRELIRR